MEQPKVGLVILPFDNVEFFSRAAESVLENTNYSNFSLIAVHNPCKAEEINEEIRKIMEYFFHHYDNFSYTINKKNLYHGKGSMEGVQFLPQDTDYVGLLNDDIFIPGNQIDWLEMLVDFMEENPNAATATPSLYHLRETVYWMGRKEGSSTHDFLHLPKGDPRLPKSSFKTTYNNMACCLTRYKLLLEFPLGNYCPHYGSDESYCNQINDKYPESEHWVLPEIKLYHENIFARRENHGEDKVVDG